MTLAMDECPVAQVEIRGVNMVALTRNFSGYLRDFAWIKQ